MRQPLRASARARRLLGRLGAGCLLAIIPAKLARVAGIDNAVLGAGPSLFGPAGLLFLLLSGSGRLSRLSLPWQALLVGTFSLLLEVVQLCPRPGLLRYARYTFDYLDLVATAVSITAAYFVAAAILKRSPANGSGG